MKRILFVLLALCAFSASAQAELVLREDTAAQSVLIGPFVDSTDGNTAETGLTIANTDVRISINGANIVGKNSGGCTHDEIGYYACTFDATDTATVGRMQVMVHKSGALPVYHEFSVVEEAVYDACCAASAAPLDQAGVRTAVGLVTANLDTQLSGLQSDADNIQTRIPAALVSGRMDSSVGAMAANTLTATAIATDAITAAKIAADAITSSEIAATAVTEIQSGLATAATQTTLDGKLDTIDTVVDAVKLKTDQLTFTVTGQVDSNTQSLNNVELVGDGTVTPFTVP